MKENIETVRQFYNSGPELEWARLESRHPFEFILTTWMMDKYIRPGDSILDIGGGPGRYSIHYAKKGCAVTLVDLSEGNVAFAKKKAAEENVSLTAYAKNCLELEELNLGQFDHVFLMGPLYHLLEEDERVRAVEAALKHLKPGGKLYVSYILVFGGVIYDMQNGGNVVPDYRNPGFRPAFDAVVTGENYRNTAGFTHSYMWHWRNILPFMERFGLEKLHFFGQEGIMAPVEPQVLERDKAEFDQWVALAKQYLEVPELLAFSEHAMYIGQKPQA